MLMAIPGAPVMDPDAAEQATALAMAKGFAGHDLLLATDRLPATYEELKGRGVEFTRSPSSGLRDRLAFRDPSAQRPADAGHDRRSDPRAAGG